MSYGANQVAELPQITSPLPVYWSTTQAPSPPGIGITQSPVPDGANQVAELPRTTHPLSAYYTSQAPSPPGLGITQSPAFAAAQITPNEPNDSTVQDPDVVFTSEMIPEKPSESIVAPVDAAVCRKRKLSHSKASRALQAASRPSLPSYPIKESKKHPGQMRAIDWLKPECEEKFKTFYEDLLAKWGVKNGHTGTCVLVPEAYRALEPLDIMEKITRGERKHASPGDSRAFFLMADHGTTVARAQAWFKRPRSIRGGAQLDVFLGSGDWAPMDGSHTCHHDHCLIHVTYEPADVNLSRQKCCIEARRLRDQNAADVPEHCSDPKHDPPCLMQVSNMAHRLIRTVQANLYSMLRLLPLKLITSSSQSCVKPKA